SLFNLFCWHREMRKREVEVHTFMTELGLKKDMMILVAVKQKNTAIHVYIDQNSQDVHLDLKKLLDNAVSLARQYAVR
ncbi:hypothetical protein ACJX0J_030672, partial [Zea mays]